MHLRASRNLWHLGAPSDPPPQCSRPQAGSPVHQKRLKKVNCFLKKGRIFIWNNSFRAQIRHSDKAKNLETSGILGRPQTPLHNAVGHRQTALHTTKRVRKVNDFLKKERIFIWNNSFRARIGLRMSLTSSRTLWLLGKRNNFHLE